MQYESSCFQCKFIAALCFISVCPLATFHCKMTCFHFLPPSTIASFGCMCTYCIHRIESYVLFRIANWNNLWKCSTSKYEVKQAGAQGNAWRGLWLWQKVGFHDVLFHSIFIFQFQFSSTLLRFEEAGRSPFFSIELWIMNNRNFGHKNTENKKLILGV